MNDIIKMLLLTLVQNASFTVVSRARNSGSIAYHAIASVFSNGIWLLVIKDVVVKLDKPSVMWAYLVGSVAGAVLMHWITVKYLEKKIKDV